MESQACPPPPPIQVQCGEPLVRVGLQAQGLHSGLWDFRVKGLDSFQLGDPVGPQTRPHSPPSRALAPCLQPCPAPRVAIFAAGAHQGKVF